MGLLLESIKLVSSRKRKLSIEAPLPSAGIQTVDSVQTPQAAAVK